MCARRFLFVVLILTLLAVAGAFAMFQFGDRLLIRSAIPKGHFTPPPPHSGPDYANDASWIAKPGLVNDPSAWRPTGEPRPLVPRPAHAFYIHPTTYLQRDRWNAPLDDRDSRNRAALFVETQASAFSDLAAVWAPRYRQAAYGAFLLDSKDAQAALGLAYADVARAFDLFIASIPPGEPIILAGHSQGALHLMRLLQEKVAGKPLLGRIVAAYIVGWPLSVTADVPALGFPACSAPDQPGCILSWMSFAEPANPKLVIDSYEGNAGLTGGKRRRDDILCVNPLTGTAGGVAPPGANGGTLVPTADLRSATLVPGRVGARCDQGLLILEGSIPPLGPYVLPGNNYHVYDYALFWDAVRDDALRRERGWQASR
ncbi:MAG TPA: DUF3089 domain-containing protein [Sphingomicrobium sp.]|nr:DUF3089 domain-containing protein [Sphingomicrobium sp.]